MRKARKVLHAPTNSEAITRALEEAVVNNDVEMSLKELLRKGRGRLVDVYQEVRTSNASRPDARR